MSWYGLTLRGTLVLPDSSYFTKAVTKVVSSYHITYPPYAESQRHICVKVCHVCHSVTFRAKSSYFQGSDRLWGGGRECVTSVIFAGYAH